MSAERSDNKTAFRLLGIVLIMGAASIAAVPFYTWFCKVTGFAGVTQQADEGSDIVLEREVTVHFDASKVRGMPWEFKPVQTSMKVRVGETALAFYEAYNPTDRPIAGSAVYSVMPYSMGYYFTKIECFCFTEQVLQPGERVDMPVSFYVDPEMVDSRETKDVLDMTLSYTFREIDLPEEVTSLTTSGGETVN
ncbi:cytochrome c oxidase assembly protein [Halovulum sp. GXIMD14793]